MENVFIIAINPGSTSTKIAVFQNTNPVYVKTLRHSAEELAGFDKISDQFQFRKQIIAKALSDVEFSAKDVKAIVGRGGLLKPIESGVYQVTEAMKSDLLNAPFGEHASNLGGLIAADLVKDFPNAKAYIADPVVVDELDEIARFSGHPAIERRSIFHALNQKAVARSHAKSIMRKYEEMNLIVVHLGGGISVGAHSKGRVIDVNQALDGDGPFSPERSGSLPMGDFARICFAGKHNLKHVLKMIKGDGGMVAYLGTNNAYEVEQMVAAGDAKAHIVFEAMAYQVSKEIGAMAAVLKYSVDGILITGGIAHSKWFVNMIIERVHRIAPTHVYPGEDEMKALALNGLSVVKGETVPQKYV
ncbi:MAG: butyrate kinase [Bacteroidetes bacterium]|nr:butyrate kinase [Bacteroidota bacterium]MBU1719783.1 butyrate kinase [Bacteroidota bacterium]